MILIQVNNYTSLVTFPVDNSQKPIKLKHKRSYRTIVNYFIVLSVLLLFLFIKSYYKQYIYRHRKILGVQITHTTSTLDRWLRWEWRLFNCTLSLSSVLKIGFLFLMNMMVIFINGSQNIVHVSTVGDEPVSTMDIKSKEIANRHAQLSVVNMALAVCLSTKLSFIQKMFIDISDTLQWHKWLSVVAIGEMLYHATYQIHYNYLKKHSLYLAFFSSNRYTTGTWMMIAMLCLVFGSHPVIRTLSYRLFHISHLMSFFVLVGMGFLHHWTLYIFYIMVVLFWLVDQFDRSYLTKVHQLQQLPGDIIKLEVLIPYTPPTFVPGQFVFISFSSSWFLSLFNAHPFSICKVEQVTKNDTEDEDNRMSLDEASPSLPSSELYAYTFYIRARGKQTKKIYEYTQNEKCRLRISKPLGRKYLNNKAEYGDFKTIIMIADGTGITPWISVLDYLQNKEHLVKTKHVHLIWCIHSLDTYIAFEEELKMFCRSIKMDMEIDVYVTGTTDDEMISHLPSQIKFSFFKPNFSQLLSSLQEQYGDDSALSICAHEGTVVECNNIGLKYSWIIKKERFCF
ncbi:hypothetical protein BDB01DRAFT_848710 [Pilobolus umbonatus]|nr:hypothetical protein BDB01DRAFT_848710 [Pilobolus umbonatus]